MSTLNDKLNLIKDARDDIQTALAGKGQVVGKDIRDYAEAVANIEGGSGDVKLFDTVEHMQQDETAQEGDLAVVYREEIQPVTEESEFDSCIFPNEVVLDEAFTDNVFGSFRSTGGGFFDGMVDMSSSNFRFNGWGESSNINVQYTSQDGITYTRTDGGDELQEFGTTIQWDNGMGSFNSVVGNFMKIGGNYFDGLYECNEVINYGKVKPIIITDKNTISDDVNYFSIDTIKNVFDNNLENFIENCSYLTSRIKSSSAYQTYGYKAIYYYWRYFVWVLNNDNTADLYCYFSNTDGYISPFVYYNDITYLGASTNNISGTSSITLKITINLVNETMTWEDMATTVNQYKTSGNHGVLIPFSFENKKIVAYYLKPYNSNWNYTSISYNTYNATSDYISTGFTQDLTTITSHSLDYKLELIYEYAKSQLDTTREYVYEKTFYGKNGVETGALQAGVVYNNTIKNIYINIVNMFTDTGLVIRDGVGLSNLSYTELPFKINTSTMTNMYSMFYNCTNLTTIPLLDTSNVTNMSNMFSICTSLTTIPLLDTSSVTNMNSMFHTCTNLTTVPLIDTSNVTNMDSMFYNCNKLSSIPLLDTSNVIDMCRMFCNCNYLATIPLLDTSNATNMESMFFGCTSLTTIPQLDTGNVTSMYSMFNGCTSLTTIPLIDTSSVTDMRYMFESCTNLTTIPLIDTSNVTSMYQTFNGCTSLTTIPQLDTSNVTNMYSMFYNCTSLTTVPQLDTGNVTNMYSMFYDCLSLNNTSLNNILAMCINATRIPSNKKTLRYIGLTQAQATVCQSLSNWSAFISAGWTTGY